MPKDDAGNPRSGFARAGHANKVMSDRGPKSEAKPHEGKPKEGGTEKGNTNVSHMDIGEVVKQHGPAHSIHSEHKDGMHTVTSHHGGHMHHSEHSSPEEAHKHHGKALGLQQEGDAYDGEETAGEMPEVHSSGSGGSIPGMM